MKNEIMSIVLQLESEKLAATLREWDKPEPTTVAELFEQWEN